MLDDAHKNRTSHTHGQADGHTHKDFGNAFAFGTALNLGFVLIEAAFGIWANSMALLADAGHNLSDVFGLLLAWGASTLGHRLIKPHPDADSSKFH